MEGVDRLGGVSREASLSKLGVDEIWRCLSPLSSPPLSLLLPHEFSSEGLDFGAD